MSRIKWVVSDIDGVLTEASGVLYLPAVEEMRRLQKEGVGVGLVSGRPYPMVRNLGEYIGLSGPLIAENGGIGYFDGEEFVIGNRFGLESSVSKVEETLGLNRSWDDPWRVTDFAFEVRESDSLRDRLKDLSCEKADIHISSIMLHVSRSGVNKGSGLLHWASANDVRQDRVLVCGDAASDISMFDIFGHSLAPSSSIAAIRERALIRPRGEFGAGFVEGVNQCRRQGELP